VWIWLFGFVGNYFWTHYFYKVLGASYSFPVTIMLNDVRLSPIVFTSLHSPCLPARL
jgi:cycloeucalenol cycloisomerase